MLNVFEHTEPSRCPPKTFNIATVRSIFFRNVLLSAVMLNTLTCVLGLVPKKALLSAVNMLNVFGTYGLIQKGSASSKNIQHIQHIQHIQYSTESSTFLVSLPETHSTYSTLQLKEAHF